MTNKATALITGITGQDGGYLAEYLLKLGYTVVGMKRRTSSRNEDVLIDLAKRGDFQIVEGDMTDSISLRDILDAVRPDEVYNLAAQSFVSASWSQPLLTNEVNYMGVLNLLEACRNMGANRPRIYQASTSEMFGNQISPQNELTRMTPRSPYGVSKLAAHRMCNCYRESFGMFISCGILFNHESPRRGPEFVTRKIAQSVAKIAAGRQDFITLGSLDAKRDWGYAPDYVRAMWLMLQQEEPDDFVIASGETHTVLDFVREAFNTVFLFHYDLWGNNSRFQFEGELQDHHIRPFIKHDKKLTRPAEVFELRGDARLAKEVLGWQPTTNFKGLVRIMVDAEIKKLKGVKR